MSHQKEPESHSALHHIDKQSSDPQPSNQEQEPNMYTDLSVMGARDSTNATAQLIRAMIYRGKNACDQCPESIADLFKCTFPKVNITYAGPDEDVPINAETLSQVDVFAQPGGPDVDEAMEEAKPYVSAIRDFVSNGGRYVGFCLGGYMAGHDPGYSLIPAGDDVSDEIDEPNAQAKDDDDTIIQVDWTFSTGKKAGTTEKKRWVYFQDGPVFTLADDSPAKVLARYSSNGDVAALLNQFGKGWVANVGPHPEANQDWYDDEDLTNPEGVKFDIGQDFLRTAMQAGQ